MELFLENFGLSGLLDEVVTTVRPLMKKNNNTLVFEPNQNLGSMHADVTRVRQVLFNLLSNASKFTKDGKVSLAADKSSENDSEWITFPHFGHRNRNVIRATQPDCSKHFHKPMLLPPVNMAVRV